MKNVLIFILGLFSYSSLVFAGEFTLAYTKNDMKFDSLSTSPTGYSIGYRWKYDSYAPYIEYQSTTDNDANLDYSAFNFGSQFIMFSQSNFTAGYNVEGGYGIIGIDKTKNDFELLSFGGGGFVNYSINESLSFFMNGQYIYYSEITSNTKCKDGSSSESSGSGTCSHHGGVASYNDKVGNASGLKINIGLSLLF